MGHSCDRAGVDRLVDSPACGQMQPSYGGHAMNGGIVADSVDACPLLRAEIQAEGLIAGSYVEIVRTAFSGVIELHGEDIEIGGEMEKRAIFDP